MYDLALNTANAIPFVLVDTVNTEVAGLGNAFTVTLSKNGGAFGASAGTKAELGNGWYVYTTTAGECDTAGPLALRITAAGAGQQNLIYQVAANAAAVWDELIAGHAVAGSAGAALTAVVVADDPLLNAVPGTYARGTAGAALGQIGSAVVTVVSPVASDGTAITVVYGDDYLNVDGRALTFTGTNWPVITGGTVKLKVRGGATVTIFAGVVTGAAACYVELTDTQTAALTPDQYPYDLEATLSNGSVVTLAQGALTVKVDVR